jgi:hypothetical protein
MESLRVLVMTFNILISSPNEKAPKLSTDGFNDQLLLVEKRPLTCILNDLPAGNYLADESDRLKREDLSWKRKGGEKETTTY